MSFGVGHLYDIAVSVELVLRFVAVLIFLGGVGKAFPYGQARQEPVSAYPFYLIGTALRSYWYSIRRNQQSFFYRKRGIQ